MLTFIKSKFIIVISGMALLFGCATIDTENDISIKTIDSDVASIGHVSLQKDNSGTTYLRGAIQPKSLNHGKMAGHIHIEIVSSNGKTTEKKVSNFKRTSKGSTHFHFHAKVDNNILKGSVIKIRHDIAYDK